MPEEYHVHSAYNLIVLRYLQRTPIGTLINHNREGGDKLLFISRYIIMHHNVIESCITRGYIGSL